MKILYVSYLHPSIAPGGAQQVAFEMYQASLRGGHAACFIAALEDNHEATYGKPGAPFVPVQGEEGQYFYFPQQYDYLHLSVGDWRSVRFLAEFIERLKPDVIHFHHYHRVGVESIRAARVAAPDALICLTFHEMMAICMADGQMVKRGSRDLCHAASPVACNKCFPDLRPEFVILRKLRLMAALAECDLFVFPSEFIAERYVDWGLPQEKCVVIPNGQFNLGENFDRSQHSRFVNRFGFFGQFIDNKGLDVILDALLILAREQRVPPTGIVVEINGGNKHYASAAYLEKIAQQIQSLQNIPNGRITVRENGAYTREQLEGRMQSIDWVIVPSTWWEIFGLVVSEAWMFGRPVIASAIAALEERVIPEINGFTFRARDARALADLMADLVGNEEKWRAVNRSIEQPWSDAEMLDAHLSVWNDFAQDKASKKAAMSLPEPVTVPAEPVKPKRKSARRKVETM